MVAVFDKAFGPGGSGDVPTKGAAGGEAGEESSLEALVDIAHVMVSATSRIIGSRYVDVRGVVFGMGLCRVEWAPCSTWGSHGTD